MKKNLALIILLIFFLFSCGKESSISKLEKPINDSKNIESLNLAAKTAFSKKEYGLCLESYFEILDITKNLNQSEEKATTLGKIGEIYYLNSSYDIALNYFLKASEIFKNTNNNKKLCNYYHNIGLVYKAENRYENALTYFNKSLETANLIGDNFLLIDAYMDLGNTYAQMKQYDQAIVYHQKVLDESLNIGDRSYEAMAYNNLGANYQWKQDSSKALYNYLKAFEIHKNLDNALQATTAYNIGLIKKTLKEYTEAIIYFDKSIALANRFGDLQTVADAQERLAEINRLLGFSSKASQYFEDQNTTLKKLNKENLALIIIEQQNRIEVSRITLERSYQDKQNVSGSRMNILLYLSLGIATLFFSLIGLYTYERKRKKQGTSAAINLLDYLLKDNEHWKKTRGNS